MERERRLLLQSSPTTLSSNTNIISHTPTSEASAVDYVSRITESMACLIAAMDSLWFHHIILFSQPQPSSFPAPPQLHRISPRDDEMSTQETEKETATATYDDDLERPTRLNLVFAKGRSHSSSPISAQKRSRNRPKMKKSSSLKSLMDLELEEVKGFMDLGFVFRRENLTKRIIHLVPGLGLQREKQDDDEDEDEEDEDGERKEVIRPYLSEAWIVRGPNSPLMNLRIPTVSTAADMKKHLRFWAHTVASAIHQES